MLRAITPTPTEGHEVKTGLHPRPIQQPLHPTDPWNVLAHDGLISLRQASLPQIPYTNGGVWLSLTGHWLQAVLRPGTGNRERQLTPAIAQSTTKPRIVNGVLTKSLTKRTGPHCPTQFCGCSVRQSRSASSRVKRNIKPV